MAELDLELRERLRLVVLGKIGPNSCPDQIHSSLGHIFEPLMCWQGGSAVKKMSKFWIFFFLVGSLWKGPRWLLLIEKLSEMVSVDVLKGSALMLVHLKTFFFGRFHFLGICMAI